MKKTAVFIFTLVLVMGLSGCNKEGLDQPVQNVDDRSDTDVKSDEVSLDGNNLKEEVNETEKAIHQPSFLNLISDMDEEYIYYIKGMDIWRFHKGTSEKSKIYSGDAGIVGIAVQEKWIYFLELSGETSEFPYSLRKIDNTGGGHTIIEGTEASFIDISDNILFTRIFTMDGTSDILYELKGQGDSLIETRINENSVCLVKNDIRDIVFTSSDCKKVYWQEELIYEVENRNDEVFIKNYNEHYAILELHKDNMECQTLIISLDENKSVTYLDLEMQYVDVLEHWIVYIDKAELDMHFLNMAESF